MTERVGPSLAPVAASRDGGVLATSHWASATLATCLRLNL